MTRKTIFIIALLYLSGILLLGLLFFVERDLLGFVPDAFGPVPVGVPWFGALGAVLISLTGVFEHEHDWDPSYWPWHIARPLIGVALGVVSMLILQAGVLAVGSTPIRPTPTPTPAAAATPAPPASSTATPTPPGSTAKPSPGSSTATPTPPGPAATPTPSATPSPNQPSPTPVPSNLLYYLIAFLVGYREETFRELIKRLVDIVLAPGNSGAAAPTIQGVNPAQAPHATPTPVVITGTGFTGAQSVKFGDSAAQLFTVDSDAQLTATTPVLAAGAAVTLKVTTKNGSATKPFTFS